jgi:mannitol/fructose-specific phosphotransferase system IIA component (Ntr-type)
LFLLIGRDNMVGPHIKLLSRISRLMNKDEFRKKLVTAKNPAEIVQFFKEEEMSYFDI